MTSQAGLPLIGRAPWAEISDDRAYRYGLGRYWGDGPVLGWCLLNPSKADAEVNDPTIAKIIGFTARAGYGGAWVGNLFGLRATSPAALRAPGIDPAGAQNEAWLRRMLSQVPAVVLAWGDIGGQPWAHDRRMGALALVRAAGVPAYCLGLTAAGQPRHPCRLAYATPLTPWPGAAPGHPDRAAL